MKTNIFADYLSQPQKVKHLDQVVPISQSPLWESQRKYYNSKGLGAWSSGDVPHDWTNNPLIAHKYSRAILGFLEDLKNASDLKNELPQKTEIIELGCGAGRLGFYVTKFLLDSINKAPDKYAPFRVVLADISSVIIKSLQNRKELKPFVEKGVLDFAIYDAERGRVIQLLESEETIGWGDERPLFVLANYFFDSLKIDGFRVEGGEAFEVKASLSTKEGLETSVEDTALPYKIDINQVPKKIDFPYYGDKVVDQIIENYAKIVKKGSFPITIGALPFLNPFVENKASPRALIIGDKSLRTLDEMVSRLEFGFSVHGTEKGAAFSCSVNTHFINEFFKGHKGDAILDLKGPMSFSTNLFFKENESLKCLKQMFSEELGKTSQVEYSELKKRLRKKIQDPKTKKNTISLNEYNRFLNVGFFDPKFVQSFESSINKPIPFATQVVKQNFIKTLEKVWENYYPTSPKDDLPFSLGRIYFALGEIEKANRFFHLSNELTKEHHLNWLNIGRCRKQLGNEEGAKEAFLCSLELKPDFPKAQKELSSLTVN